VQEFPVGNEEPSVTSPSSPSRNKPIEETTINVADYGIEGDYVKKEEEKTKKKRRTKEESEVNARDAKETR